MPKLNNLKHINKFKNFNNIRRTGISYNSEYMGKARTS